MAKDTSNRRRVGNEEFNNESLPPEKEEYTNKFVVKGALPSTIVWEAFEKEEEGKKGVNKYQLKKKLDTNLYTIQNQVDNLKDRGILKLKKKESQSFDSVRNKKFYGLTSQFRQFMKKTNAEPLKKTFKKMAQHPEILQSSTYIVRYIREEEKTAKEIQKDLKFQNRIIVDFALRLFSQFIRQRFENGKLLYKVIKPLPLIWTEQYWYDSKENKPIIPFQGSGKDSYELKSKLFNDNKSSDGIIVAPRLDYNWILYSGECSLTKEGEKNVRIKKSPQICQDCEYTESYDEKIIEKATISKGSIEVEEPQKEKKTENNCRRRAAHALTDISLSITGGERDVLVFLKCPQDICEPEIKGGLCFANQID